MKKQNLDFVTTYSYNEARNEYIKGNDYEVVITFNSASARDLFHNNHENIVGERDIASAIKETNTQHLNKIKRYRRVEDNERCRCLGPNKHFPSVICYDDAGNVKSLSWYKKAQKADCELVRVVELNDNKINKAFENLHKCSETGKFSSDINDSFSDNFFKKIKLVEEEGARLRNHFNIAEKRHADSSVSFRLTLSNEEVLLLVVDNHRYFPEEQSIKLFDNPTSGKSRFSPS